MIAFFAITLNHFLGNVFTGMPELVIGSAVSLLALLSFVKSAVIPLPDTAIMTSKQS